MVVTFRKNKMKHASMPKFSILPSISDEILLRLCSDDLIQILLKLARFLTVMNISPTICTNMKILGKDTFLVLISLTISTNLISSQILIFVTSHFTTLYDQQLSIRPCGAIYNYKFLWLILKKVKRYENYWWGTNDCCMLI